LAASSISSRAATSISNPGDNCHFQPGGNFQFTRAQIMQDPQQTQMAVNHAMAGMGAFFLLFGLIALAFYVFNIFLYWRIFTRAGMAGAIALIAIIPNLGGFICNCILAFARWNVTPAPQGYAGYPPQYPPAPPQYSPASYPPASYPPAAYPPQDPPTL
jgi:hypothetical protein